VLFQPPCWVHETGAIPGQALKWLPSHWIPCSHVFYVQRLAASAALTAADKRITIPGVSAPIIAKTRFEPKHCDPRFRVSNSDALRQGLHG